MKNNEWPDLVESRTEREDFGQRLRDRVERKLFPTRLQRAWSAVLYILTFGLLILVSGAAVAAVIALGIWLVRLALGW